MNKKILIPIIAIVILAAGIGGYFVSRKSASPEINSEAKRNIPYYFIAIHNEPLPDEAYPEMTMEKSYETLKKIIQKADNYNIKLTLMLTPRWIDYIVISPERLADLESWKKKGHEIAAHHHTETHALWDGYTNIPKEKAIELRKKIRKDGKPETYRGTMDDYINKLKTINPSIKAGCLNDDRNPAMMPDEIIYSTCSGFGNSGELGRIVKDGNPIKGINEYLTVAYINGIKRSYLAHAQVNNDNLREKAEELFKSMNSGVYGAVAHSIENNIATGSLKEAETIMEFMDFLHSKDPNGEKSRTVSEIIDQKLLPEK